MARTNPNKANQYKPDPRQQVFLANYLDPKKETFSNCYQSALAAGYEDEYARTLTAKMPTWLAENVNDMEMVQTALLNLKEFIGSKNRDQRLKFDATMQVLKNLHRKFKNEKDQETSQSLTFNVTNYYGSQNNRKGTVGGLDTSVPPEVHHEV